MYVIVYVIQYIDKYLIVIKLLSRIQAKNHIIVPVMQIMSHMTFQVDLGQ